MGIFDFFLIQPYLEAGKHASQRHNMLLLLHKAHLGTAYTHTHDGCVSMQPKYQNSCYPTIIIY